MEHQLCESSAFFYLAIIWYTETIKNMFESFIQSVNSVFGQNLTSTREFFLFLFYYGGWLVLFWFLFYASMVMFYIYRVGKFIGSFEWQFLAIDIPKENEQSPMAVENIFAHLAGAHMTRDLKEKFWDGQWQQWFSFEIVSIDGYIQYIIMTEKLFRDLVESVIYAQYPDAEITEIEDYTKQFPTQFPDPKYKIWGTEFELVDTPYVPIRTYEEFEHSLSQEFKDPMAALLETFSRIGAGEQAWFQIVVFPINQQWKKAGFALAKEALGKKETPPRKWYHNVVDFPLYVVQLIIHGFSNDGTPPPVLGGGGGDEQTGRFDLGTWNMTPGEVDRVKAIERKVSKIGYNIKIRTAYVAPHEIFDKSRIVYGVVGAIKQFTKEDLNALKPAYKTTGTSAHYIFMERRKDIRRTKLMGAYKSRSAWTGKIPFVLNIEELATIWHFPVDTVRAPLLQKTISKRGEAPMGLPRDAGIGGAQAAAVTQSQSAKAPAGGDLPFVDVSGDGEKPQWESGDDSAPDNLPFV